MTFYVMDFDNKKAWAFYPSEKWLRQHDNGHAVSIGFVLREDISENQLKHFIGTGRATEVEYDKANHASCQSGCIRRGDKMCRW